MKKTFSILSVLAVALGGITASAQNYCCPTQPVNNCTTETYCNQPTFCDTTATVCNQQSYACCNLPQNAQTFVSCYYDGQNVESVAYNPKKEKSEYKVKFANGQEVTFDGNGNWKEIEAPYGQCIPAGIAPDFITKYLTNNFPTSGINELEKAGKGYEVGLTTGQGLLFSKNGEFVTVD